MMTFIRRLLCGLGLHAWKQDSWYDTQEGWCHKCRRCGATAHTSIPTH